jgi:hypothetical protein
MTYLLLFLRLEPHLKKIQGIGIMTRATKPSSDIAQANPSFRTIWAVNRGNDDEIVNRMKFVAAKAEAP